MKPFLKWVGSKRQMIPELSCYVPKTFGTYFEPFVGSGALFFHVQPKKAVLSDSNKRLMKTYQAVRNRPAQLVRVLREHQGLHCEDHYWGMRSEDIDSCGVVETAAWMIYLNKAGFNGLYRVNKAGTFNVPWGKRTADCIVDEPTILACSRALKRGDVKLLTCSYQKAIEMAGDNDFVYADPPYPAISKTANFKAYDKAGFGIGDHEELRDSLVRARHRGATVIATISDTVFSRSLYSGDRFAIRQVRGSRSVSASAESRAPVGELLIRLR